MAFSRDGKTFATTHSRNKIRLYDAVTDRVLADLEAPNAGEITGLVFNHDGTQLAATGSAYVLRLWDLRQIRRRLADLGLGWEESAYPAKPPASPPSGEAAAR